MVATREGHESTLILLPPFKWKVEPELLHSFLSCLPMLTSICLYHILEKAFFALLPHTEVLTRGHQSILWEFDETPIVFFLCQ